VNAPLRQIVCPHCNSVNQLPSARLAQRPYCSRCDGDLFSGQPVELNARNFDKQIGGGDIPVVVNFWTPESQPCRIMKSAFERAAVSLEPDVRLARLNLEAAPQIAQRLGVREVPTLLAFRQGREIGRRSGALPILQLMGWIGDQCRMEPAVIAAARPNPALRL